MTCDIAVIILTLNEAPNLPHALGSVSGWAREIIVVDSNSTDDTVDIATRAGCRVVLHEFEDYAKQRNFALEGIPINASWVFFMDADEWLTEELKSEISGIVASQRSENGFFVKWRMMWMGTWVRRGYYPTWILRMFRRGAGRCENRAVNEHMVVDGPIGYLENDFVHQDRKGLDHWIRKHVDYATREAAELLRLDEVGRRGELELKFWGSQAQRKRWLRYRVWNRLPPLVRPFLYFAYRVILRGGILDGPRAFTYHVLHAFWFHFLVDTKYLERKLAKKSGDEP